MYVYRHIRLDKNQPFYIGIGGSNDGYLFERAFCKTGRNNHWNHIVKNIDYEVEILIDDITWEEACEKEIEFIALYGRRDKGKGPLVNLTDGGEGTLGNKQSPERLEQTRLMSKVVEKPIFQYDMEGKLIQEWPSAAEAGRNVGVTNTVITSVCKNKRKSAAGYVWRYKGKDWFEPIYINNRNSPEANRKQKRCKVVVQYDMNMNYIDEFYSISEANRQTKVDVSSIVGMCNGKFKHAGGYIWKFKENINN